jgi:PAS domain S-box-containing protein
MGVELLDSGMFGGAAEATALISSVLEASTEYSIIATDLAGVILLWNEGARRLYGYQAGESIGRRKSMLHPEPDVLAGCPRS